MIESTPTTVRADPLAGMWIRLVACCLGAGGGLYLIGMIGLYHAILDPLPRTTSLAIAGPIRGGRSRCSGGSDGAIRGCASRRA